MLLFKNRRGTKSHGVIEPRFLVRYALAVGLAIAGLAILVPLEPLWGPELTYITLFLAVMLSAWFGGLGAGFVTTMLSAAASAYYWLPPAHSFRIDDATKWIGLFAFAVIGGVISALNEASHRHTRALERAQNELRTSEARVTADAAALTRLNTLSSILWRMRNKREGLEEMLSATIELVGADMGTIQILDRGRRVLTIAAHRGFRDDFLEFLREVSAEDQSACGRSLRSGQRIVIEDVESDSLYAALRPAASAAGYRAVQSTPLLDPEGKPVGIISTHWRSVHRPSDQELSRLDLYARQASDFIERWRTEEALEERDRRFRLALEAGRLGTWEWSLATGNVLWSAPLEAIHGLEPGTFAGTLEASRRNLHPEDVEQVRTSMARSLDTGADYYVEYRILWPDGSVHWVEDRGSVVRDSDGRPIGMTGVCADVSTRRLAEEAIRERRFRIMADSAPVLIWLSGTDSRCTWFNRRWLEFVGRTMEQEVDDGWRENVHASDLGRCLSAYAEAFGARREFSREYRLRRHDGEYRWVLDNGIATYGPSGEFTGYVGSCVDITERKQNEADLQHVSSLKDEFLAVASHELRTPLAGLQLNLQLLSRGTFVDDSAHRERLAVALRGCRQLGSLIERLLEVGRVATGHLELERTKVDLNALVRDVAERFEAQFSAAGCAVDVRFAESSATGFWDKLRLEQVLANLLTNAIKFGAGKPIEIVCAVDNGTAHVRIQDRGMGIAAGDQERIFKRFERGVPPRHYGGLGLGLWISREIVERHGGTLRVESHSGEGASFMMDLPRAQTAEVS